ncbi:hypothetical protein ACLS0R_10165 [Comamonas jiangduensis]|uniref:hypothetical protein n=1 Tax=Comamonas jiangduensis TaxID=1194168 RepID=UPI003BF7F857
MTEQVARRFQQMAAGNGVQRAAAAGHAAQIQRARAAGRAREGGLRAQRGDGAARLK